MTPQQAIKLLKNGEAQLYVDCDSPATVSIIFNNVSKPDPFIRGSYMRKTLLGFEAYFLDKTGLPIIKLSEIEEQCECRTEGDALYQCDNCYEKAVKDHVCDYHCDNGGFCLKRSDEAVKRNIREVKSLLRPNYGRVEKTGESEYTVYLTNPLKVGETFKLDELSIEKPKLKISKEMLDFGKSNWFTGDLTNLESHIQSLKTTTMQVTNNNGEITLNGIVIDNETADRIVEIRKEQLGKPVLETGKWYKDKYGRLFYPTKIHNDRSCDAYGFGWIKKEFIAEDHGLVGWEINGSEVPATDQEVTEALKSEAVKRGLHEGRHHWPEKSYLGIRQSVSDFTYDDVSGYPRLTNSNMENVFQSGKWAVAGLPTYTHAEIEAKIGEFNYKP